MKAIILSKSDYSFPDTKTGEIREGSKAFYLIANGTEPILLSINNNSGNMHLKEQITTVPAMYELDTARTVKKGQLVEVITSAKLIKEMDFFK